MREFPVNDWAYTALVDTEDFDFLDRWLWTCLVKKGKPTYVMRRQGKEPNRFTFYMHKVVAERIGLNVTGIIDHIDRNPFNNQRNNLREATHSQNLANKESVNTVTGFRGVYEKRPGQYYVQITVNGNKEPLGSFRDKVQAALAYDHRAKQAFGPFAQLNFPGA